MFPCKLAAYFQNTFLSFQSRKKYGPWFYNFENSDYCYNKFASDNKTGWICDLEWDKSSYLSGTSIVHDLLKSNETLACM